MYSRAHAAIGALVSVAWITSGPADPPPTTAVALLAYGVGVSVLVDLDHFLLARAHAGDWTHLQRALSEPARALWDQSWVLEGIEELERERLATHAAVGTALVVGLSVVSFDFAAFTAVLLAAHVAADVLRDLGLA